MSINGNARDVLTELLKKTIELGGSDLHLRVDSPPQVRIHGKLRPLEGYASLGPDDARQLAISYLNSDQRRAFDEKRELDLSIGLEGVSRFRVNVFQQKETVGGVVPLVTESVRPAVGHVKALDHFRRGAASKAVRRDVPRHHGVRGDNGA